MSQREMKNLIIEDNAEDRSSFRYFLNKDSKHVYEFFEEELGEAGIKTCFEQNPDCVLLDYDLPDTNGLDVLKKINPDALDPAFPVILLTGAGNEKLAVRAIKDGAQDYLVKGKITSEELSLTIRNAVEIFSLRRRQRQSEDSLLQYAEILKIGAEITEFAICEIDYKTNINRISKEAAALFGLGDSEMSVPREAVHATFHPDEREKLAALIKQSLQPDSDGWFASDHRIVLKNGEIRWLSVRKRIFFDRTVNPPCPTHGILAAQDITTRKKAESEREKSFERERILRHEAEDANRAKDEFLAMLSHELRSPLNAMLGWTQILEKSDYDREITAKAVEIIARNVRLQNALIEDLLDVSRIISGKMRLESENVSLVSIIRESLDAARPAAEKRLIEIQSNLDAAADEIFGDKHRLQQIIANLLTNAIKFTPESGVISVTLECSDNSANLFIKDSGIGIAPSILPHIFDRFRQADASLKRQFGGLGLGLTIVKYLVELHGGTITAESEGEGKGATFAVKLPLNVPIASHADLKPAGDGNVFDNSKPLAGKRILVVDDDRDALDLICFVMNQRGAEVICVDSVKDALANLRRNDFDLLISDLGMPGMDGYDLIRQVREQEIGSRALIPAIALTGYVSTEDRERVIKAGFQTHLSKPVNIEKLSNAALGFINEAKTETE